VSVGTESVVPLLRGGFGRPYLYEASCASTQDVLRGSGLPHGAVAVTDHQTGGRGRLGRSWEVLCSVLLRPDGGAPPAAQLSLVAGLAVAEAVEAVTGVVAQLKWPNDVLLGGAKVAGILLEADGGAVVCGIGVNVEQEAAELPERPSIPAGSLRTATGRSHDRALLVVTLLDRLERRYDGWVAGGLEGLLPELGARDALIGRHIRVGDRVGTADGIAADGRLRLLVAGAPVLVESGEVLTIDR
jgi:BirA family transcriptional regulator, biotin operon repressor / biotin---[acetyl-CoA-carboxylase] ligase